MKGGRTDAAWSHGEMVDEKGKKVKCNYCTKVVSGITRFKLHLAKIGGNVRSCPSVPESVRLEFNNCFQQRPYPTVIVKPDMNRNMGESSRAGAQSSCTHQQTTRDAQVENGGSHHQVVRRQIRLDIDLEKIPDIGASIEANREEINQMVADKMYERNLNKKHVDGGSSNADVVWGGHHIDQTAAAEKTKSNAALIEEAKIAQKHISLFRKAYKVYRHKVSAEQEKFRKFQEMKDQQLREKVQEVEAKNQELGSLKAALVAKDKKLEHFQAALKAKDKELAAKDDEMERLWRGATAAQAEWYLDGRDEIIIKAKEVGLNHKLLLPDPAVDPTE